jgi:alpha-tubulin suppressor-like RCC1 family protein
VQNLNTNGTASVSNQNASVLFVSSNSQIYYQSSKNSTWFNRCTTSSSYLITFIFSLPHDGGILSAEVTTFTSSLKISFSASSANQMMTISFGNFYYSSVTVPIQDLYTISIVSTGTSINIYSNYTLIYTNSNFSTLASGSPSIKFGVIYKPGTININGTQQNIFQANYNGTNIFLNQIKFSFNVNDFTNNTSIYTLTLPYVMPNAAPVRVLKTLNSNIFAATKSITDLRSTSNYSDIGSKVYQFNGTQWEDVTGNFEVYSQGVSTAFVISSPNDIGALNNSYFITGLSKSIPAKKTLASEIIIGVSSYLAYEESNLIVSLVYPYNPGASGTYIYLSSNNSLINLPSSVYFAPSDLAHSFSVGIASTSLVSTTSITATDNISFATSTVSILPIKLSAVSLNASSFVGYSIANIVATATLQSVPKTDRTFNITSSSPSLLSIPNSGIATVRAGAATTNITLNVGIATTASSTINISGSYRSSIQTASIAINPFVLTSGLSTSNFVGNQLYGPVVYSASVQAAPRMNLNLQASSGLSTVLSGQNNFILAGALSTSFPLTIGAAVTSNLLFNVTGIVTGSISTSSITATPFIVTSATATNYTPIYGLQTSYVTFTLNTTPTNNILIYNVVNNAAGVSMVFPSTTSVIGGSISTTFGVSTTKQTSANLVTTIQGAPLGYNTSPSPGLLLTSDIWRITNLIVSPQSIVGGAAYANGIAQSYIISATLNYSAIGLATTILLSSNSSYVSFNTSQMNFFGVAASTGFATGFSTSYTTGIAITASGPNGVTSTITGLVLNPLLISGVTTSYVWSQPPAYSYTVGGIGATIQVTASLNAYVYGTAQTISFSSFDTHLYSYGPQYANRLGFGTILPGSISTTISLGVSSVPSSISTNVTATLLGSATGIGTTVINIQPFPGYNIIFNPFFGNGISTYTIYVNSPIPISVGYAITFSNSQNSFGSIPNSFIQKSIYYNQINQDTTLTAQSSVLGVLQTYYVTGYAQSGGVFGMGYNNSNVLTSNYPIGGAATKLYLGISTVVKVSSGYEHSIALDVNGSAWTIGDNLYGQLGRNTSPLNYSPSFNRVYAPNGYMIRDVFAENNTTYIIAADNSLFAFGDNSVGQFGTSAYYHSNTYIPQLISTSVQQLSVYQDNGVILIYNNFTGIQSVFEFGSQQSVQGLVGKGITQFTYAGYNKNISNLNILNINRGYNHTVATGIWTDVALGIGSSGIFAWGNNNFGQLGTNYPTGFVSTPNIIYKYISSIASSPVEVCNIVIADGDASSGFTLAVGSANSIYFVGAQNSYNSAGVGVGYNTTISQYPALGFATNSPIYRIAKDSQHYMWTLGIGSVYVSGGIKSQNYNFTTSTDSSFTPRNIFGQGFDSNYSSFYYNGLGSLNGYIGLYYAPINGLNQGNFQFDANYFDIGTFYQVHKITSNFMLTYYINNQTAYSFLYAYYNTTHGFTLLYASNVSLTGPGDADFINIDSNALFYPKGIQGYALFSILGNGAYGRIDIININSSSYGSRIAGNQFVISSTLILRPAYFIVSKYLSYYSWKSSNAFLIQNYLDFVVNQGAYLTSWYIPITTQPGSVEPTTQGTPVQSGSFTADSSVTVATSIYNSSTSYAQGNGPSYYSSLIVATQNGTVYRWEGTNARNLANNSVFATAPTQINLSDVVGSSVGYAIVLGYYPPDTNIFLVGTSANYLIAVNSVTLAIYGSVLVPITGTNKITSITWQTNNLSPNGLFVVTDSAGNNYLYKVPINFNFEIGLNYSNSTGNYQLLTYDGTQTGIGMTNISYSSTSDTFSVVIDTSRPNG